MPRSRGSAAPRRPTAGPSSQSRAPSQPQKRPATTAAYPPAQQGQAARPQGQQQSPGLFGQMASTAAYVCHTSVLFAFPFLSLSVSGKPTTSTACLSMHRGRNICLRMKAYIFIEVLRLARP